MFGFEKLAVWKTARDFNKSIYKITLSFPKKETFILVTQMRRAALSVCSNIAEGSSRKSSKDQAHFYHLSYSSLMELLNQCIIAKDLDFMTNIQLSECRQEVRKISTMLNSLRNKCLRKINEVKPLDP